MHFVASRCVLLAFYFVKRIEKHIELLWWWCASCASCAFNGRTREKKSRFKNIYSSLAFSMHFKQIHSLFTCSSRQSVSTVVCSVLTTQKTHWASYKIWVSIVHRCTIRAGNSQLNNIIDSPGKKEAHEGRPFSIFSRCFLDKYNILIIVCSMLTSFYGFSLSLSFLLFAVCAVYEIRRRSIKCDVCAHSSHSLLYTETTNGTYRFIYTCLLSYHFSFWFSFILFVFMKRLSLARSGFVCVSAVCSAHYLKEQNE